MRVIGKGEQLAMESLEEVLGYMRLFSERMSVLQMGFTFLEHLSFMSPASRQVFVRTWVPTILAFLTGSEHKLAIRRSGCNVITCWYSGFDPSSSREVEQATLENDGPLLAIFEDVENCGSAAVVATFHLFDCVKQNTALREIMGMEWCQGREKAL